MDQLIKLWKWPVRLIIRST